MQSPPPASSLVEPPPAASPQLGRWICQQGLRSARMRSLLLVLAAARVLLLLLCCYCCCAAAAVLLLLLAAAAAACCCCCCLLLLLLLAAAAASTTAALLAFLRLVTFRTGMIILELATTTYCCIYLLSVQSPAPASSLAEPPPAANPQLGRWVCQQGLRSAIIWGRLLVLALPVLLPLLPLRRRLPFLAFLRLVTFRTGMTVILLLQYCCYGFSRYGIRVTLLYALVRVARGTAW